ncbi:MAG: hypothetical protein HY328_04300 [Chloroflexi bacterium]|nr:hypothetical protein [Chloroflexota bacterium]
MNLFRSLREYEEFLYTLPQRYPAVAASTLVVARRGATVASVNGDVIFRSGYRLVIRERLVFEAGPVTLVRYSYEVWFGQEQQYWYDPQPHPDIPSLARNHPHHKHIPPDIKHRFRQAQSKPHPRAGAFLQRAQPALSDPGGGGADREGRIERG